MEEKDTSKSNLSNSENSLQKSYFEFFEYAPIALFIEDFSKVKTFVEEEVKNADTDIETYLIENPKVAESLHEKVIIKDVNVAAVKMYNAVGKKDLLENLVKVFTPNSAIGFTKLVTDILCGKRETVVETVNKTLDGEIINISIKFNVGSGSEENLENVIVSIEDITERIKATNDLAISERRYKESQEVAKMSSWFFDFNTLELYWSDEGFSMVGLEPQLDKLSLDFYLSFVHKKDRELVGDFSYENLISNPNQNLNYRIYTKQGELKYIYEKRSAIISNGKVQRIVGTCQDITERTLSEKKLTTTKKLLSNTLSSIQDGFVILDNNSNYLYVNRVASELLEKTEEELIGKNIWEEFPEKVGDLFYDNYQIAFKTKTTLSFENYFAPWNRWFENRIIPSNDTMLIFFHETTLQKKSKSKIKAAYNIINKSSSVAILCKNSWDFPVVFASENSEKLFGYTYKELLSQKVNLHEMVYPGDLKYIQGHFFSLLKGGIIKSSKPKPFRIITKGGTMKWIEAGIDIIRNESGEVTHIQGIAQDITERKKTEDLFFESTQRLKDQFNNTPLASIIWDLDFKVIEWNDSAERIFGYSLEEAKGKHANELIIPKSIEADINNNWEDLLNQRGGSRSKNENTTKNGDIIICDWYNVTLKDVDGNVIGVASMVDDVTERTFSKELLEKSEKKYRDLFDKSVDPVFLLKDGLFVDCNVSTLELFGYSDKESLFRIHPSKVSPEFQPDGENSFKKADRMINIALENGSNRFRWYHKKNNGNVFPAEVSLTKIGEDSNEITIHAVVRDISERVKKEELESILYNISNAALTIEDFVEFGHFIREELYKIIDTSNFYIALYNEEENSFHAPVLVDEVEEDIVSFPAEHSLTGYVLKTKKSMLFTNETHTKLIDSGEVGLVGQDSKIWVGVPLIAQEKVFGVIVVQSYTNIEAYTKSDVQLLEFVADQISIAILRKNIENELKIALSKAQESDRLKSAFLANMSHEIRTPMNGIIGFSELFLDKDLSYPERKEYAKIVINSSKQLLSIVNDVLDISKIEAGVVQLNYESVNVNQLLSEIEAFYRPISLEQNLELICSKGLIDSDSVIEIDRTKLNQIISNLMSNAFKFTDEGSVEFGYKLEDKKLQFFVSDSGLGIDKELHDVIFDRFIQAENDFEKQNKGTGLGLAISKRFVELFKGEIWIDSTGNGTTVFFTIPYSKVTSNNIESIIDIKPKTATKSAEIVILVAEDEEYNLLYMNELFSKTQYKLVEANNGKEAVEIVRENPLINLVLMDIKMPIMNGYDAMKEIKAMRADLPVIALSAFAMESDKETALASGFNSYLSKPIDKKILFDLIEKYTN